MPLVSVVIPGLDEAESIGACVRGTWCTLDAHGIDGEVVVADNGSTDSSGFLAAAAGARAVREPRRGYGSAYRTGFDAARGATS
jgi:glycosyltransferase involved in cell wall biosynthesis